MPRSWNSGRRLNSIVMGSDYQLRMFAFDQIAGGIEYSVESFTDYRALEPMTERDRARYTRLPEDRNPRTQAMVQSWLREDPSPDTIIDRALDIFRGEEFFYTLTPPGLGTHSADEFIFETREGFCEHYASAFAIMLRAAGIPTRVVTGYQGGELNPLGQYYIVRQSDAHAWTEVWREQSGWQRVDPITAVAPERIALGSIRGAAAVGATAGAALGSMRLLRQAMLAWDTVSTYWNRWVIGYSPQIQRNLLEWFGFERPRMAELLSSALISTLVLMIALSGWLTLRFRRTRRRDAPAESFALLMRRLQRHRIAPLAPGESPTAYARRAAERLPAAAGTIERIVADYLLARYEPDPDRAALGRLTDGVRHFRPHGAPASP
jgi:hypothetical protein